MIWRLLLHGRWQVADCKSKLRSSMIHEEAQKILRLPHIFQVQVGNPKLEISPVKEAIRHTKQTSRSPENNLRDDQKE